MGAIFSQSYARETTKRGCLSERFGRLPRAGGYKRGISFTLSALASVSRSGRRLLHDRVLPPVLRPACSGLDASLETNCRRSLRGAGGLFGHHFPRANAVGRHFPSNQQVVGVSRPRESSTFNAHVLSSTHRPLQFSTGRFEKCANAICNFRKREVASWMG